MGTFVDTVSSTPNQICPYNKNHIIPSRKFTAHIMECAKIYGQNDYVTCPYYAKHRMAKYLVEDHLNLCEHMVPGVIDDRQMAQYKEWAKLKPVSSEMEKQLKDAETSHEQWD